MDSSQEALFEKSLRQMDVMTTSVLQIQEQLEDIHDFGRALSRIERSIEMLRYGGLGFPCGSKDLARLRKHSGAGGAGGAGGASADKHNDNDAAGPRRVYSHTSENNSGTPGMYKMVELLEEPFFEHHNTCCLN